MRSQCDPTAPHPRGGHNQCLRKVTGVGGERSGGMRWGGDLKASWDKRREASGLTLAGCQVSSMCRTG